MAQGQEYPEVLTKGKYVFHYFMLVFYVLMTHKTNYLYCTETNIIVTVSLVGWQHEGEQKDRRVDRRHHQPLLALL